MQAELDTVMAVYQHYYDDKEDYDQAYLETIHAIPPKLLSKLASK